jgi:hypothetical protein
MTTTQINQDNQDIELNPRPYFQLLHALIRHDGSDAEIERTTKTLRWLDRGGKNKELQAVTHQEEWDLICDVMRHRSLHHSAPKRETLEATVVTRDKHKAALDVLTRYGKEADSLLVIDHADMQMYLSQRIADYRTQHLIRSLKTAKRIATGSIQLPDGRKERTWSGIDDAGQYVRRAMMRDVGPGSTSVIEGDWAENADPIEQALVDMLRNPSRNRVYTGFQAIDEAISIGPSEPFKFIGLLGYTNHFKTGMLLNKLYNMARSGKKILLVPREMTVEETWMRLTFMHAEFFKVALPSLSFWRKKSHQVTDEHIDNLKVVLDDLRSGASIKGSIEVISASTWAEIEEYLQSHDEPLDVLAVDYLSHLNTGKSGNDHREEIKTIIRKAQLISREYKNKRGLVVISPLQANREGMKTANEQEAEDWGVYHDTNAIEWYSQAAQDMDLIIGVWFTGALKDQNLVKVSCMKSRDEYFRTFHLRLDPRTLYLRDHTSANATPGHIPTPKPAEDYSFSDAPDDSPWMMEDFVVKRDKEVA